MKTRFIACAIVCLFLIVSRALAAPQSITVDLSKPGVRVSPMLYGIFFEEINHAGDGGLYAEMVRNRSFEDDATAGGWSPEGGAKIALDSTQPLNQESPHSLR